MARTAGVAPTIFAGLRLRETTYVYDDPEHPDRVTRVIHSPDYVAEDHAMLLGLQLYEDSLCPGCGWPKHVAWHADMDGWFDAHEVKCHACTARREAGADGTRAPVTYTYTVDTRPEDDLVLRPFVLGLTTTST